MDRDEGAGHPAHVAESQWNPRSSSTIEFPMVSIRLRV